jgi:hypothetical protein
MSLPIRVYVAGKFTRYEEVRALIDALPEGCVVTHDWTRTEEFDEDGHPKADDTEVPSERLAMHAINDLRGVRSADLLILIGDENLCGAMAEVGAALVLGIPVWVVGPCRYTIFWELPDVGRLPDVEATIEELDAALEVLHAL